MCLAFCVIVRYQAVATNLTDDERSTRQASGNWPYDPYGVIAPYFSPAPQYYDVGGI